MHIFEVLVIFFSEIKIFCLLLLHKKKKKMQTLSLFTNPKPFIGIRQIGGLWKSCICTLTNSGQSPGNCNTDSFCALLFAMNCSKLVIPTMVRTVLGKLIHIAPGTAGDTFLGQLKPAPSFLKRVHFHLRFEPRF